MSEISSVLIGEGKPEPINNQEKKKADTLYNRHMQEIFDIVAPAGIKEREDAAAVQADIAVATAQELQKKSTAWQRYKKHQNLKRFVNELDTEWRGRELPHRMERILLNFVVGGTSTGINMLTDAVAHRAFLHTHEGYLIPWRGSGFIPLEDKYGNRDALKAGWKMINSTAIGAFGNVSVQEATNRHDVKFVSPLSDAFSKVGNIALTLKFGEERRGLGRALNVVSNPSTIEAGFRTLSALPVGGAVIERAYVAVNKVLEKEKGLIPFGFDLSAAMLAAKAKQMSKFAEK